MLFRKSKKILENKIDELNENLVKSNISEIVTILGSKKEIFIRNFMAGVSRGIGIGIGVTIISAILVYILQKIVTLNIPVIGTYIKDIVDIVQKST